MLVARLSPMSTQDNSIQYPELERWVKQKTDDTRIRSGADVQLPHMHVAVKRGEGIPCVDKAETTKKTMRKCHDTWIQRYGERVVLSKGAVLSETGWSEAVLDSVLVATGVHRVLKNDAVYSFSTEDGLKEVTDLEDVDEAINIIEEIKNTSKLPIKTICPKYKLIPSKAGKDSEGEAADNVFKGASRSAKLEASGLYNDKGGGLTPVVGAEVFESALNASKTIVLPVLEPEDLQKFGFMLVDEGSPFVLNAPVEVGIAPVMTICLGKDYYQKIPGGSNIEQHASLHMWIPMETSCGGFVVAGRVVEEHEGGVREKGSLKRELDPSAEREMEFAAIKIPYGKALVGADWAWHSDSYLSDGLYLVSFGFPKGTKEVQDAGTVTYQPLLNTSEKRISFKICETGISATHLHENPGAFVDHLKRTGVSRELVSS